MESVIAPQSVTITHEPKNFGLELVLPISGMSLVDDSLAKEVILPDHFMQVLTLFHCCIYIRLCNTLPKRRLLD